MELDRCSSYSPSWRGQDKLQLTLFNHRILAEMTTVITQATRLHDCTDCTKLCNTVYYAVLLMMNDYIRSKHVEQTKNCGIKIDYKNCASLWLLTHYNMMHGTHNVTLTHCSMMHGTHNVTLITVKCLTRLSYSGDHGF